MLCCDCMLQRGFRENALLGHHNEHCFRYLARLKVKRDVKEFLGACCVVSR